MEAKLKLGKLYRGKLMKLNKNIIFSKPQIVSYLPKDYFMEDMRISIQDTIDPEWRVMRAIIHSSVMFESLAHSLGVASTEMDNNK